MIPQVKSLPSPVLEGNWSKVLDLTHRLLVGKFSNDPAKNPVLEMLWSLADDEDPKTLSSPAPDRPRKWYPGLRLAPAAKTNHHVYFGGLVVHYLEMYKHYEVLRDHIYGGSIPRIEDYRVWAGILFHDLHKAVKGYMVVEDYQMVPNGTGDGFRLEYPSRIEYGEHPSNKLLGSDQKTVQILMEHGVVLDVIQANALYWSEGGWAEAPPKHMFVLAKLLYVLDELSGNVAGRLNQGFNAMVDRGHGAFLTEQECGLE